MQWIEVKVVFDPPGHGRADRELAADLIADIFYDFGLQGVVVEDPDIDPQEDWAEDAVGRADCHAVVAYLPEDSRAETRCRTLESKLAHLKTQSGIVSRVSYKKRDHAWKAYFWPQKISRRLVVKPTWRAYTPAPDEMVIELDPGMAFGTGTHPTTALCAAMIETHLKERDRFLDVGTGSGILMIAAARLGAARVCGIDRDETAIAVAAANLKLNSIEPQRYELKTANLIDETSGTYDIIAANILTRVILDLIVDIRRVLAPGGIFICSGIIEKNQGPLMFWRRLLKTSGWRLLHALRREALGSGLKAKAPEKQRFGLEPCALSRAPLLLSLEPLVLLLPGLYTWERL